MKDSKISRYIAPAAAVLFAGCLPKMVPPVTSGDLSREFSDDFSERVSETLDPGSTAGSRPESCPPKGAHFAERIAASIELGEECFEYGDEQL